MKMIPSSPLSRLYALHRANDGVATIELAMITPVVCLLLLGVVDIAQATAMRLDLTQAAQRATELALARRPMSDTDTAYLKEEAAKAAKIPQNEVKVKLYSICGTQEEKYTETLCVAPAPISRFVSVTVEKTYSPIFNYGPFVKMLGGTSNGLSAMKLTGKSLVRVQ